MKRARNFSAVAAVVLSGRTSTTSGNRASATTCPKGHCPTQTNLRFGGIAAIDSGE